MLVLAHGSNFCVKKFICEQSCVIFSTECAGLRGEPSNYTLAKVVCIGSKAGSHLTHFMSGLLAYMSSLLERYGPYGPSKDDAKTMTRSNSCPDLLKTSRNNTSKNSNIGSSSGYSTMSADDSSAGFFSGLKKYSFSDVSCIHVSLYQLLFCSLIPHEL